LTSTINGPWLELESELRALLDDRLLDDWLAALEDRNDDELADERELAEERELDDARELADDGELADDCELAETCADACADELELWRLLLRLLLRLEDRDDADDVRELCALVEAELGRQALTASQNKGCVTIKLTSATTNV